MKGSNTIIINGRAYDAISGMPASPAQHPKQHAPKTHGTLHRAFSDISGPHKTAMQPLTKKLPTNRMPAQQSPAATVHQAPQRSHTLHRGSLQRPNTLIASAPSRSPHISKFGSLQANIATPVATQVIADTPPQIHPAVAKVTEHPASIPVKPAHVLTSKELKEQLIKERLAQVHNHTQPKNERRGLMHRQPRLTAVLTSTLAILLLGGYLTYINLPNISMRVAATRAGVAANFPNYQPDGYSFQGPITYTPGEVAINFKSNTNNQSFTVKQKGSNWDSQAVLDNFVTKQTKTYLTYQERGLTIYSFDNKAAWVNGGLLYTIEGNAKLSNEQVLRLATSM